MEDIKEITMQRFKNELERKFAFSLPNEVPLEKVIESYAIEHEDYFNVLPIEVTRNIFDKALVDPQLNALWFMACKQDNVALYEFIIRGIQWKRGSEKSSAYQSQKKFIHEFKPQKITHWFFSNHKTYGGLMSSAGSSFLKMVENNKKMAHSLISSSAFSTNTQEVYNYLKETDNSYMFDKIMKKNLKHFNNKNNVILSCALKEENFEFYEKIQVFFEKQPLEAKGQLSKTWGIHFFPIMKFIENSQLNKNLQNNLIDKDKAKKLKI